MNKETDDLHSDLRESHDEVEGLIQERKVRAEKG